MFLQACRPCLHARSSLLPVVHLLLSLWLLSPSHTSFLVVSQTLQAHPPWVVFDQLFPLPRMLSSHDLFPLPLGLDQSKFSSFPIKYNPHTCFSILIPPHNPNSPPVSIYLLIIWCLFSPLEHKLLGTPILPMLCVLQRLYIH